MRRIFLKIAYDGTNYVGWQVQPNGTAIEEVLNHALSKLLNENIVVIGASRTDSGVHAVGNICVFDTESRIPAEKFKFAINEFLPDDIACIESKEVPISFHPRKVNSIKTYEYRILNRQIRDPKERNYSYFFYYPLDEEKMDRAAKVLLGEHDFKSFCSIRTDVEDTVRTITDISVTRSGEIITLRISGNGFLYNMVRIIAGTLVKIGTGIFPEDCMEGILEARDRSKSGPKAPANGLTLVSIEEEEKLPDFVEEENAHWAYSLDQHLIETEQKALFVFHRADEADYDRILLKNTKQLSRNGALQIFVCDEMGKLEENDKADYFTYRLAEKSEIPDAFLEKCPAKGPIYVTCDERKNKLVEEGLLDE